MPTEDGPQPTSEDPSVAQVIVEEVRRHYEQPTERPYFLADLGNFVRGKALVLSPEHSLANYIKRHLGGDLTIVRNPYVPARVAVALMANKDTVRRLVQQSPTKGGDSNKIPFSLVAAFCRSAEKPVFFSIRPPFRYVESETSPGEQFVEIEPAYRRYNESIDSRRLTEDQREEIYRRIADWAKAKHVDLRRLHVASEAPASAARAASAPRAASVESTFLQRLIDAQDPDLKARFRIPLDIVELLLRGG